MRSSLIALIAGLTALPTTLALPAQAQECGPLKRAFSVDLQTGPQGLRYGVPVTVNGTPRVFLLDTGGAFTQVSRGLAAQMGLTVQTARGVQMFDMYGNTVAGRYVVADIGLGPLMAKGAETMVTDVGGMDGVLAPDYMMNYDIEMDFAGRKLNYFLTDHCDGKVIYWPATTVAAVAFRGWDNYRSTHMTIPVTLDGKEIIATVDTGATSTTLNQDTARAAFDVTTDSPGAVPLGTMGNSGRPMFGWTFKTLAIGGITVTNPRITVIPNLVGGRSADTLTADSRVRRITDNMAPTMLIGMDVLKQLRVYIASKEKKLYVTAATAPAPAQAAPPAPPPGN
jgi:predicted aspartyl protease